MKRTAARRRRGFTLLEVMVAVAILAIALSAVFSAEAGSVRTAQRARKMGLATLLVRCKMGEIEEDLEKKGLPAIFASGADKCCKGAEIEGFKCKWEIQPIVLPDTMFGDDDEDKDKPGKKPGAGPELANANPGAAKSGSSTGSGSGLSSMLGAAAAALGGKSDSKTGETKPGSKDDKKTSSSKDKETPKDLLSGDPTRFLASGGGGDIDGITAMAMQFVYPALKPSFQSQIRRATVTVSWPEGDTTKSFDVTQYVVGEQPVPLATDPNNPNALLGASGTTTGTGTGTTGTGTGTTPSLGTGLH
jgi:general secretion pathway protein I